MVDFELSTTRENGKVKTRLLEFNGSEYDLTEKPVLWFGATGVVLTIFFSILYGIVFVVSQVFTYLSNTGAIGGLIGLGVLFFQLAVLVFLSIIILGVIKYLITGNAEPFISVDINTSSETGDAD